MKGFPMRIQIPLNYTLYLEVEFANLVVTLLPENFFSIPSGLAYKNRKDAQKTLIRQTKRLMLANIYIWYYKSFFFWIDIVKCGLLDVVDQLTQLEHQHCHGLELYSEFGRLAWRVIDLDLPIFPCIFNIYECPRIRYWLHVLQDCESWLVDCPLTFNLNSYSPLQFSEMANMPWDNPYGIIQAGTSADCPDRGYWRSRNLSRIWSLTGNLLRTREVCSEEHTIFIWLWLLCSWWTLRFEWAFVRVQQDRLATPLEFITRKIINSKQIKNASLVFREASDPDGLFFRLTNLNLLVSIPLIRVRIVNAAYFLDLQQ